MPSSAQQSMATIDQFINAVGTVKAADGSTPLSEPGSIGGETEHPVKKVDDRLEKAKEGFRSTENSKDVKEDQGKPSVENAPEAKAGNDRRAASVFDVVGQFAAGRMKKAEGGSGTASEDHKAVNMKVTGTGEDPSNETSSAKAGKEDKKQGNVGGTNHPASTENDQIDGHKWASDPLEKLAADMREIGNNLCAQISWISQNQGNHQTAQAASQHTTKQAQQAYQPQADIDPYLSQQLGWEMAGLVNGTFDKRAADSLVVGTMEQIVKTASDDADRFIHFMDNFLKQAEGEMPPMEGGGEMPPGGGGEMPPGGGGGGPGGGDPSAMMAALGGGADAGGGGAHPGMGGEGGEGGEGGGDPEAMQLAQILEQLGVTPEELEQAMQAEQAGGGAGGPPGGGPPGGGMAPPPGGGGGAPPPGGGMEAQAGDRYGQGRQKQAESDKYAHARQFISEIVQRSRARKS